MTWLSWCIAIVPILIIIALGLYAGRYVRGVADFLAAGRVAGRYVISVGDLESALGVITLVALVEERYQTGFALGFWGGLMIPISLLLSLSGFCIYRFRETRCLSIGQFLELRYSRSFRIFAALLRTISEMLANAIGPAVAARFFIYFLGLPPVYTVLGIPLSTFGLLIGGILVLSLTVIWPAGRISLIITDCFQGLMSYPIFVIFTVYVLTQFSWGGEIAPIMQDRAPGESFLNPMDISHLRDFNLFALFVAILSGIINRASWIGNDTSGSARTPHEQKMAGILGAWRNGFSSVMCLLIAISVITLMAHPRFATKAREVRLALTERVAGEVVSDPSVREHLIENLRAIPEQPHRIGIDQPLSREQNPDTIYLTTALDTLNREIPAEGEGNAVFQKFRTLYYQMMMPASMGHLFPPVLMGLFALLIIMLMLSTDDSRIFNASATLVQDVIMPLRRTPFDRKTHLRWLRFASVGVALFFFFVSFYLAHMDYISMFLTITTSIWLGGAGPIMLFGLYSRFGTTAGAWAALLFGSGLSVGGIFLQRRWADLVYPWIDRCGWTLPLDTFLKSISAPLAPYIVWAMDPVKFPINSREIYFLSILAAFAGYVFFSWLTRKAPYNLDRMLHRGLYAIDGEHRPVAVSNLRHLYNVLIGIGPEHTRGDKIISWSVFIYSFVYQFLICFVGVLIWNAIRPLPLSWWSGYFLYVNLVVASVVGVISTVWLMTGAVVDMRRLFRDLNARKDDPLDDGWVEGNVSAADQERVKAVEEKK
ncbi:MAG TPA: sodium:panthothenate symporter [Kiritimatiellia bacterium]|nr:sodium:panthothenate symporter [Kiritimatiellia bacterium]